MSCGRHRLAQRALAAAVVAASWCSSWRAWAQPAPPVEAEVSIDELVARELFERAMVLFGRGDVANAKQLFIETLERSPTGTRSGDARAMVRTCNERLGIEDRDHGLPGHESAPVTETAPSQAPLDPYAGAKAPGGLAQPPSPMSSMDRNARIGLTTWAGAYGLTLGLALAGPMNEIDGADDELRGAAVLAGLAGAGGVAGLSYWLSGRYQLREGQSAAIASGAAWGSLAFALFGDVVTGDDSDTNDVFKIMAAGGAVGIGGGIAYALVSEPSPGDVAFTNSMAAYGLATGLFLGVAIDPPKGEAYSLQGFLGTAAGVAAGLLVSRHVELSRTRTLWLDLGAAAGAAATWVVIYPLIADGGTDNDEQAAGALTIATMAGGVIGAWWLSRSVDDGEAGGRATALYSRDADGTWRLGSLSPSLLPVSGGWGATVRLADGVF